MIPIKIAQTFEQANINAHELTVNLPFLLGFDVETTVGREDNYASIIQLSTNDGIYIFQAYRIFKDKGILPKKLVKILQNPNIVKVGVGLSNDLDQIQAYGVKPRGFIDCQSIAITKGLPKISMEDLISYYSLNVTKSSLDLNWNWDGDLINEQVQYAAADAHLALSIYQRMISDVKPVTIARQMDNLNDYYDWLIKALTIPFKLDKLINLSCNSYGPWIRKYPKPEIRNLVTKVLNDFIIDGKIKLDRVTERVYI